MKQEEWIFCEECGDSVLRASPHGQAIISKDDDELLRIHEEVEEERLLRDLPREGDAAKIAFIGNREYSMGVYLGVVKDLDHGLVAVVRLPGSPYLVEIHPSRVKPL